MTTNAAHRFRAGLAHLGLAVTLFILIRECWKTQFDHGIDLMYVGVTAIPILFHWIRSRSVEFDALHGFEIGVRAAMSSTLLAALLLFARLWFPIGHPLFLGDVDRVGRMFLGLAILVPAFAIIAATIVAAGILAGLLFRSLDRVQFAPAIVLQTMLISIAAVVPISTLLSHAIWGASLVKTIKRLIG